MRMLKFMVPFVLALIVSAGSEAAEKSVAKLTGELSAKPADAKAGVVAVLSTKGRKGKDGTVAEVKKYNLFAEGAVATQITEMVGKIEKVDITGSGTPQEYKVATIAESKRKEKAAK